MPYNRFHPLFGPGSFDGQPTAGHFTVPYECGRLGTYIRVFERSMIVDLRLVIVVLTAAMAIACETAPPPLLETSVETDRAALMALFDSTDGENWKVSDGWGGSLPLSYWNGVTTINNLMGMRGGSCYGADVIGPDPEGLVPRERSRRHEYCERVVGLTLTDNGLTGEIPPELGNLSLLQFLNLKGNQLRGEIPSDLGNLTALVYELDLSFNQLTGQIPSEFGQIQNHQL